MSEVEIPKCVWIIDDGLGSEKKTDSVCKGKIENRPMFDNQLSMPCCEKHYQEHKVIVCLHKNGYDITEVINQSCAWRQNEVDELIRLGVKFEEIVP